MRQTETVQTSHCRFGMIVVSSFTCRKLTSVYALGIENPPTCLLFVGKELNTLFKPRRADYHT